MCQAIDDLIADGKAEGREEGREETVGVLIETCYEFGMPREAVIKRMIQKCNMEEEKAEELYDKIIFGK